MLDPMLKLGGITIDGPDPETLARFWCSALGYQARQLWDPYAGGTDPDRQSPNLTFQHSVDQPANHLHLDLYADDPDAEATRLAESGATWIRRVDEGDTWWWVMRDPAGNEFCVIAAQGEGRDLDPHYGKG